jgi:hypothetical protein
MFREKMSMFIEKNGQSRVTAVVEKIRKRWRRLVRDSENFKNVTNKMRNVNGINASGEKSDGGDCMLSLDNIRKWSENDTLESDRWQENVELK